jgi:hypothetical protein
MNCRNCHAPLQLVLADLGNMPLSNAMLEAGQLAQPEPRYPLRVLVCQDCWLVQTEDFARAPQIFNSAYTYFSSYSESWLNHARRFAEAITDRLQLDVNSQVIEIASNDGYLLQHFKQRNIPVLGIEPAANTAAVARQKGIATLVDFFGTKLALDLAAEGLQANLIVGNNVLAHVPDINDFVAGLPLLLADDGVITMEFPHLVKLIEGCQFDTIYHEHFSYLSLTVVDSVFSRHGLRIFDVEELDTHGGSLRIYACGLAFSAERNHAVNALLQSEDDFGIRSSAYYRGFQNRIEAVRDGFQRFIHTVKADGKTMAGYGAAAKGNTLMNYCGITADELHFVADLSPHKQGKFLPGSHIPVLHPDEIRNRKPTFVVILPWNLQEEIMAQLSYIREWGGKFVVAVPELEVL